jgi:hypothetical protein
MAPTPSALQSICQDLVRCAPVPLTVWASPMLSGDTEIRVCARDSKGGGYAATMIDGLAVVAAEIRPGAITRMIEKTVRSCAARALTEYLVDHETRQGWPPRECLHDRTDHELEEDA